MTSPIAWSLAIALFHILAGAVYLARQLEAKRRAALAAWADAGGWRFDPTPEPVPPDTVTAAEASGAVARYNAHQRFPEATFPRAGEVAVHLFELRPARGAVRWSCLAAELGTDLALTFPARDDGVLTAQTTQNGRRLVVRAATPATAAIYDELTAIARALLGQAGPEHPS